MKYLLLLFCISLNALTVAAQDTIRVTYSEEPDTLIVRQKFIDRYDNVFMTRVPTQNLVKAGYNSSDVRGIGIALGYEYKILPQLSIEASFFMKTNNTGDVIYSNTFAKEWTQNWWVGMKARWYYNMGKRIEKGLNANNFSGAYVAASVDRRVGNVDFFSPINSNRHTIGIATGFQSRVFNRGHVDFSLGAYYLDQSPKSYIPHYYQSSRDPRNKNFILSTQMTVGIAFGDWAQKVPTEACEVLLCDEEIQNQWKLRFPEASLGLGQRSLRLGIAREAKFGKSPFSIDISSNAEFYDTELARIKGFSIKTALQGRYYLLQPIQIRRGKSGNNLSGFYTALEIANYMAKRNTSASYPLFNARYWGASFSAGFQQRLFRNIFIDSAISVNEFSSAVPYDYGVNYRRVTARLALGFTF
ncbi:hypothetical protein [Dyadobacter soli]|nr:hypothetical protein [Dyadobacter soli]